MRRLIPLLLLAACQNPVAPEGDVTPIALTPAIVAAYQVALDCGLQHGLTPIRPLSGLRLFLTASHWVVVNGEEEAGVNIGNRIYISQERKAHMWTYSHEFLHAVFGLRGATPATHPPIFAACGLI